MNTKLKNFLDQNNIKYEVHEHKKVYTAFNEAETQHLKVKEVAKVVLVKTEKNYVLVVVPAGKHVDFTKVKKALKAKKVSMARENDIAKILKSKIGLIHPFGNIYNLPVVCDNSLLKQRKLIASAGSYTESLTVSVKDFIKLAQPLKGKLTK